MTRLSQRRRNPRRSAMTETPAFKRWFGDSKILNMWGEPLVVYHGSDESDIEVFAVPEHRGRLYPMFFFSDDDEVAAEYGEHVYSVYLRMERPLVVDAEGADWAAIPRSAIKTRGWAAQDKKAAQEFMEDNRGDALDEDTSTDVIGALAQAIGFDGAIINNVIDSASGDTYVPTTVYIVFDPTQIKSATNNAGTFASDDPSIYRNPRRNGRGRYTTAERTDPDLWEAVKREVTAGNKGGLPGQWSARKAQLAVLLYKQRGGGYWGEKSPTNSLAKWTREKWRTKSGRPSLETGERYLPSRAIAALTDAEYRATTRAKRAGMRKGQQFVPQPEDVAAKTARYRRNPVENVSNDRYYLRGRYGPAKAMFSDVAGIYGQAPEELLRRSVSDAFAELGVPDDAKAYVLDYLVVRDRSKGTGTQIVRDIENRLRDEGVAVVFLVATALSSDARDSWRSWVGEREKTSTPFWKRIGYEVVPGDYSVNEPWGWDDQTRVMYKVLGRQNPARRGARVRTNPTPPVRAYRENPPHRPLPKRRVLELLADPVSRRALRRFYRALAYYQLPQDYSKEGFREAYDALPEEVKDALTYRGRKRLWRGADSQQIGDPAISWSTSKSWAKWFGYCLFPFSDLAGYDATIDTSRAAALVRNTEIEDDYGACDEENEVIVLGARWKKKMGHDELVSLRRKDRM